MVDTDSPLELALLRLDHLQPHRGRLDRQLYKSSDFLKAMTYPSLRKYANYTQMASAKRGALTFSTRFAVTSFSPAAAHLCSSRTSSVTLSAVSRGIAGRRVL